MGGRSKKQLFAASSVDAGKQISFLLVTTREAVSPLFQVFKSQVKANSCWV